MRVAVKSHALPVCKKNRIASLLCIFESTIDTLLSSRYGEHNTNTNTKYKHKYNIQKKIQNKRQYINAHLQNVLEAEVLYIHKSKQQRHRPSCTCAWLICALSFAIIETLAVTCLAKSHLSHRGIDRSSQNVT